MIAVSDETGTRINLDSERTLVLTVFDGNHHSNPKQLFDEGGADALPDGGWQITLERRSEVVMEYLLDSGSMYDAAVIWYDAVQTLTNPNIDSVILLNGKSALSTAVTFRTHSQKRQAEAAIQGEAI